MKEKIKNLLNSLLGREPTEAEISKAVEGLKEEKPEPDKPAETKPTEEKPEKNQVDISAVLSELSEVRKMLAEEKTARERAEQTNQERTAADKKSKVDAFIESAKNKQLIPAEDKEAEARIRKLAEVDLDATVATLMPDYGKEQTKAAPESNQQQQQSGGVQRPATLSDLRAKAESGFKTVGGKI